MKIYQVKIFYDNSLIKLEIEMNKFLKKLSTPLVKAICIKDGTETWFGYVTYITNS